MPSPGPPPRIAVSPASVRDPAVARLLDALTAELATSGYTEAETFGYSADQLEANGVHLVGAWVDDDLVGVAGLEVQADGYAELKRFFVGPAHRGAGVADRLLDVLVGQARARGAGVLRLETGDKQHAAIGFYRRHGFEVVPRFGPYVDSATSVCMQRPLPDSSAG